MIIGFIRLFFIFIKFINLSNSVSNFQIIFNLNFLELIINLINYLSSLLIIIL